MSLIAILTMTVGAGLIVVPLVYAVVSVALVRKRGSMKIWETMNGAGLLLGSLSLLGAALMFQGGRLAGIEMRHLLSMAFWVGGAILGLAIVSSIVRLSICVLRRRATNSGAGGQGELP